MRLVHLLEDYSLAKWGTFATEFEKWLFEYGYLNQYGFGRLPPGKFTWRGYSLSRIGHGQSRHAYRVGDTKIVLKIGSEHDNRREQGVYRSTGPVGRRYLARFLALSQEGRVAVMLYVPNPRPVGSDQHPEDPMVTRMWNIRNKYLGDVSDIHADNVRTTERGHPKLVDYAG
jgi:hypothetical protein